MDMLRVALHALEGALKELAMILCAQHEADVRCSEAGLRAL